MIRQIGMEEVHRRYGFKEAAVYDLMYRGKPYPSKAVLGIAYSIEHPDDPDWQGFSGGEPVKRVLGQWFTIEPKRAPTVLGQKLVEGNDDGGVYKEALEFIETLSQETLKQTIEEYRHRLQRNDWTAELSEYNEPRNWVFVVPNEPGEFWGRLLLAIAFKNSKGKHLQHARLNGTDGPLREKLERLGMAAIPWKGVEARKARRQQNEDFKEGKRESAERKYFVRNAALARKIKKDADYTCQCCLFKGPDEFDQFGERCIEAHHLKAFGERTDEQHTDNVSTDPKDMVALCANCHRVIHSKSPSLSMDELKALRRETL